MLPNELKNAVEEFLSQHGGTPCSIADFSPVSGGCIHRAGKIGCSAGTFFIKYNTPESLGNFQAESRGLALLADAGSLQTPALLGCGTSPKHSFLLLRWVESGRKEADFWQDFGRSLAGLHQNHAPRFGLDHDNFIGSLPQSNGFRATWHDFFCEMRLEPQLALAADNGFAGPQLRSGIGNIMRRLDELVPKEEPALLHGDLWSGNFMTGQNGRVCVLDPSIYYGHREAEIAFTRLFGGFREEFYKSYNEENALEKDWELRCDLFNLYPLLVHLNLFGRAYLPEILSIVGKFA